MVNDTAGTSSNGRAPVLGLSHTGNEGSTPFVPGASFPQIDLVFHKLPMRLVETKAFTVWCIEQMRLQASMDSAQL